MELADLEKEWRWVNMTDGMLGRQPPFGFCALYLDPDKTYWVRVGFHDACSFVHAPQLEDARRVINQAHRMYSSGRHSDQEIKDYLSSLDGYLGLLPRSSKKTANTVSLRERIALCADFSPAERDFILQAVNRHGGDG